MKTTKKRQASPDLTESDIDDAPRKRKATARKSTGGAPVGRRLPISTSAGPSARRASGTQSGWGGGGGGEGGSKSSALRGRMHFTDFAFCGWGFARVQPLDPRKRKGSDLGPSLFARSESTNGARIFSFESSRFHDSYALQPPSTLATIGFSISVSGLSRSFCRFEKSRRT